MSDFKVIDKDGEWFVNVGEFPLPDYQRHAEEKGTELIILQPGVPVKIKASAYLKAQPMLAKAPNPFGDDEPEAKKK